MRVLTTKVYRVARTILAIVGLAWAVITVSPLTLRWARLLAGPWNDPQGDVLIVFGADQPSDGFIGAATYWRCVYAARVWRSAGFTTVVVSGGNGIAESMKNFLVFSGIPADRIVTETQSQSTRENALYTAEIVRSLSGRKILLGSDFHMYRSIRALRRVGVEATPYPIPYALKIGSAPIQRWPVFLMLCVEAAKIEYYRWNDWI